ncbi:uncharacterized protein N7479_007250 [Penicillium vulpinum]|uniref:Structure-specific endonuclease subunit SLX4 n=1 Tax=Penicillium vulpinum TaxID=29845 RepID=A0A1V6S0Q5_9EURO|nr:uncharacterized protein N7479_007250 [Penicillium vulpinum]KAJ5960100.1 hypothetical protein N7479_007250 [Penicillium vulpinum]OQE07438.1 hypothetical protein PENVUL_c013G07324 [Penicillium vulpinum]
MASIADVIILSSSPNPPRSPGPIRHAEKHVSRVLPRDATPPPIYLTSDLSQPHTRSRFFPTPITSNKCTEDVAKPKKRSTKKDPTSGPSNQTAPSKPRRKAKKAADAPGTIALGNPQSETVSAENGAVKPTKGRPRKNAKGKDSGNMTLAGKVTKTSGDPPVKKSTKGGKKTVATKLSPSGDVPERITPKKSNALGENEVLHLDEAMRRRMDWTPPRETACEETATANDGGSQDKDHYPNLTGGFSKLLSDYNYSGSALNPRDLVQNVNGGGPTKRRRIELVNPEIQALLNGRYSDSSDQASAQRENVASAGKPKRTTKGNPKKFTTLTARMTAQYSTNDAEEDELVIDCLPDIRTAKGRRRKTKETEKESSFTVLSPEAAVEFLNDQDLVFGTCSQLERDDSPQTLRETQQAIRASEGLSYTEGTRNNDSRAIQESPTRFVSRLAGTRNLWCVGARDTEGSLIQPEKLNVVDLTNGEEPPAEKRHENVEKASHKPLQRNWFELEFADIDSPPEKTKRSLNSETQVQAPAPIPAATVTAVTKAKATKPAKPANPAKGTDRTPTEVADSWPTASQAPSMPQYTGFTDTELAKQVSTYGFKAVRGRKKMIDLLQQCWESKHGSNTTSDSQPIYQPEQQKEPISKMDNVPTPTSSAKTKETVKSKFGTSTNNRKSLDVTKSTLRTNLQTSPKKSSRGKPVAETSTSFIDVEEIQDSEEEIIPFPSQVQKHYTDIYSKSKTGSWVQPHSLDILTKTPPPSPTKRKVVPSKISAKRPSSSTSITTTHTAEPSKEISLAEISAQITQAVRAQPRLSPLSSSRGSRSRPTWHEKILMYDPIVLEDFTAWLNIEGLGLVGEDREVGTASVREWCESKGICCCWKKNAGW